MKYTEYRTSNLRAIEADLTNISPGKLDCLTEKLSKEKCHQLVFLKVGKEELCLFLSSIPSHATLSILTTLKGIKSQLLAICKINMHQFVSVTWLLGNKHINVSLFTFDNVCMVQLV